MRSFSFIHTADLHLDSPFSGLHQVDSEVAALLREATFGAFENVLDLALREKVDFLLVAGDVYDGVDRSLRAQLRFNAGLRRLAEAGIRSFVCHGNHDPLDGWSASLHWPEVVHIFGPQLESIVLPVQGQDVVRIHGISYPHRNIEGSFGKGFQRKGHEPFQIGLFHCSVGSDPAHETYAPRTLEELAAANLDYWALGHVHTHRVLRDGHPLIAYSGTTQGRHIREPGERGCLLVRVDVGGQVEARFIPVDAVRWFSRELQIDDLETEGDLLQALDWIAEEIRDDSESRSAIARITLCGRGPLNPVLRRPRVAEDLTERLRETGREGGALVWFERIQVQTNPEIDLDSRRQSADFLGEILRLAEQHRQQSDQLHEALAELYEDRRGLSFLEFPDSEQLQQLIREAEIMCVDQLVEEESQ